MAAAGRYLQEKLMDGVLRHQAYSFPGTVYVALFTTTVTDAGTGTECADANYARQSMAFNAWVAGVGNTNNGAVTFPALAASQSIAAVEIRDAVAAGNQLFYENLPTPVAFTAGQSPRIVDQGLTASLV